MLHKRCMVRVLVIAAGALLFVIGYDIGHTSQHILATGKSDLQQLMVEAEEPAAAGSQCAGGAAAEHLYFLKVQKSGGTTTQNLFLRFATLRRLNVVTLTNHCVYSYHRRNFDNALPRPPSCLGQEGGRYDIYCEHSVYDEAYLTSKILHTDTVNIAIIREPMSHLRSHFRAMNFASQFQELKHLLDPVAKFLDNPKQYRLQDPVNGSRVEERTSNFFPKVFGFNSNGPYSVDAYLSYLESRFLVLIFERLSESMIVMRRQLCWSMKDVLYPHARKATYHKPADVNDTLVKLHKTWSPLDYTYYAHFQQVMARTISEQGDDLQQEVAMFDGYLDRTHAFCHRVCRRVGTLIRENADRERLQSVLRDAEFFDASRWDDAFNVTGVDCIMMALSPVHYRAAQGVHLFPENCGKKKEEGTLKAAKAYCQDYFAYNLPWAILYKPQFVSTCYSVKAKQ